MKENWVYRRGDLYLANLGVPVGSKQGGVRPVVVLQNDVGNYYAPTITIAPLTSKIEKKRKQPTHFFLRKAKGLAKPSMVLAEQLDTCDKICVISYLGRVSKGQMRGDDEAVRIKQRKKDRANAERMAKKAMDKLITRKEAASILGISVKTLDAARTDGLISYVQYVENGCVYFTEVGIQEYIAKCTHRAKPMERAATYRKPRSFRR